MCARRFAEWTFLCFSKMCQNSTSVVETFQCVRFVHSETHFEKKKPEQKNRLTCVRTGMINVGEKTRPSVVSPTHCTCTHVDGARSENDDDRVPTSRSFPDTVENIIILSITTRPIMITATI